MMIEVHTRSITGRPTKKTHEISDVVRISVHEGHARILFMMSSVRLATRKLGFLLSSAVRRSTKFRAQSTCLDQSFYTREKWLRAAPARPLQHDIRYPSPYRQKKQRVRLWE